MATSKQLVEMSVDLGRLAARLQAASESVRQGDYSHDPQVQRILDGVEGLLASASKRTLRASRRVNDLFAVNNSYKENDAEARRTGN